MSERKTHCKHVEAQSARGCVCCSELGKDWDFQLVYQTFLCRFSIFFRRHFAFLSLLFCVLSKYGSVALEPGAISTIQHKRSTWVDGTQ